MEGSYTHLVEVAEGLEQAGLLWNPQVGDEVTDREEHSKVSVLINECRMSPGELRSTYLWLPTIEQMIAQCEMRQAVLFHAGLELSEELLAYKIVVQRAGEAFENIAETFRVALGGALREVIEASSSKNKAVH